MNTNTEQVLILALQELGCIWITEDVAEIRSNADKLAILLGVNRLIKKGELDEIKLKRGASEFCFVYYRVMLKDVEEEIPHGDES